MINQLHLAMIELYKGDAKRIQHFCKVHSYAKLTACRLVIANEAYGIVTGVNLPMLIEMCSAQMMDEGLSIQELMDKAAEAGKSGMQFFHASQIAVDDDDEDDDLL